MCGDSGAGAETCAPARDDADALENATTFSEERMEEITSLLAYAELPALLMDLDRCDEELGAALWALLSSTEMERPEDIGRPMVLIACWSSS
ncbi:MAG: hypothetical protein AAB737_02545, partial [Patescibacteria group bacterium]